MNVLEINNSIYGQNNIIYTNNLDNISTVL
jgi:hypothetical protein